MSDIRHHPTYRRAQRFLNTRGLRKFRRELRHIVLTATLVAAEPADVRTLGQRLIMKHVRQKECKRHLRRAAILWYWKLKGPDLSLSAWKGFCAWSATPEHREVFHVVSRVWEAVIEARQRTLSKVLISASG